MPENLDLSGGLSSASAPLRPLLGDIRGFGSKKFTCDVGNFSDWLLEGDFGTLAAVISVKGSHLPPFWGARSRFYSWKKSKLDAESNVGEKSGES